MEEVGAGKQTISSWEWLFAYRNKWVYTPRQMGGASTQTTPGHFSAKQLEDLRLQSFEMYKLGIILIFFNWTPDVCIDCN